MPDISLQKIAYAKSMAKRKKFLHSMAMVSKLEL